MYPEISARLIRTGLPYSIVENSSTAVHGYPERIQNMISVCIPGAFFNGLT